MLMLLLLIFIVFHFIGNPIALMIHKLKLIDNKVSLILSDTFLAEDEENYDKPAQIVLDSFLTFDY
jgi:hypothetical protein